jgi:hypothetical protein
MGILDTLFGIRKLPPPSTDGLFKLPPACVTMEEALDVRPSGKAGIGFRAFDTKSFEAVKSDILSILDNSEFYGRYSVVEDEYHFTWVLLENPSVDDLVAGIHMVSQLLVDGGFGERILCAVFEFKRRAQTLYWVYNYRRGKFYPFMPQKNKERDVTFEYRLKTLVSDELPIESLDYWYPLWGIPF